MLDNGVTVLIHTDRLRHNVRRLLTLCHDFLPVLKADAYGHGVEKLAAILEEEGVGLFGVGTVGEGARLRRAGVRAGLVAMLGILSQEEINRAAELGVMPLTHSLDSLNRLQNASGPINIAIKCDTGMNRLGFTQNDLPALLDALKKLPNVHPKLVITHLARADDPEGDELTATQLCRFARFVGVLRETFPDMRASCLNSPGLLVWPELCKNTPDLRELSPLALALARPGLLVYGENPLHGSPREALGEGFLPVMEAKTTVLSVRCLAQGESVSYGHTYTAPSPRVVAVVAAGYAEGFPRSLSGRGFVNFHGGRAPIIGRVCMQMTLVDVTDLPRVCAGDTAWLIGGPDDGSTPPLTASEQAGYASTISYELLCALGRNHREYLP